MRAAGCSASPRAFSCWENAATACSWRRFQRNSTPAPTATTAEVRNQRARGDKLNDDLDCDTYDALCSAPLLVGASPSGALREYRTGMAKPAEIDHNRRLNHQR